MFANWVGKSTDDPSAPFGNYNWTNATQCPISSVIVDDTNPGDQRYIWLNQTNGVMDQLTWFFRIPSQP